MINLIFLKFIMSLYKVISDNKIVFKNKITLDNGAHTFSSFTLPINTIIQFNRDTILTNNPKIKIYYFKVIKSPENNLNDLISIWWSPTIKGVPIINDNLIQIEKKEYTTEKLFSKK